MTPTPIIGQTKKPAAVKSFNPGDRVKSPNFGIGVVLTAQSVGADTLYEVAFETVGTKKMMGTYAKLTPAD
jgi:DNA helicase-2/ATP-dependent DNA helicase PcrA